MLYKEGLRRVCHSESPADAAGFLDELSPPLALDVRISLYGAMIFHVPYLANLDTMVGRRGAADRQERRLHLSGHERQSLLMRHVITRSPRS